MNGQTRRSPSGTIGQVVPQSFAEKLAHAIGTRCITCNAILPARATGKYDKCVACSKLRLHGPSVYVESPSGDYVEFGGIESAESLLSHTNGNTVHSPA